MAPLRPKYSKAVKQRARAYLDYVNSRIEPYAETSRDFRAVIQHPGLFTGVDDDSGGESPYELEDEDSYFTEFGLLQHSNRNSVTEAGYQEPSSHGRASPEIFGVGATYHSWNDPRSTTPPGEPDGRAIPDLFSNTATHQSPNIPLNNNLQREIGDDARSDLFDAAEVFERCHDQLRSLPFDFTCQSQSAPVSSRPDGVSVNEQHLGYPYIEDFSDNCDAALDERRARAQTALEHYRFYLGDSRYGGILTSDHAAVASPGTIQPSHIERAVSSPEAGPPAYNPLSGMQGGLSAGTLHLPQWHNIQPASFEGQMPFYPVGVHISRGLHRVDHRARTQTGPYPNQAHSGSRQESGHEIENDNRTVNPEPRGTNSTPAETDEVHQGLRHEAGTLERQQATKTRLSDDTPINDRTSSQRASFGACQDASNSISHALCCGSIYDAPCCEKHLHRIYWSGIETEHIEYRDDVTNKDLERERNENEQTRANGSGSLTHDMQHNQRVQEDIRDEDATHHDPEDENDVYGLRSRLRTHAGELSDSSPEPGSPSSTNEDIILTHRPRAFYPPARRSQFGGSVQPVSNVSISLPFPESPSTTLDQAAYTPLPRGSVSSINTNPYLMYGTPNIMPDRAFNSEYRGRPENDISESRHSPDPDSLPDLVPSSPHRDDVMYEIELNSTNPSQNADEDDWVSISSKVASEERQTRARVFSYLDPELMGMPLASYLYSALLRPESRREEHAAVARRQAEVERAGADMERDEERAGNGEAEEAEDSWVEVHDTEESRTDSRLT